jgi:putative lipoprotein (rSAM/lipoprotein system)
MKIKLLENHNKFIAYLLAIIGIGGACSFGGCAYGVGPVAPEYGVPSATFKVLGTVSSEQSLNIKGIRVVMRTDTAHTDVDGKFQVQTNDFPKNQDFDIEFDDVDGELNGAFQSLDTIVSFINPKFKNPDGHWYSGETSKEFNVKLKSKN